MRNCSRICASRIRADFVIALGVTARFALGPKRFLSPPLLSCANAADEAVLEGTFDGVFSRGVSAAEVGMLPNSSSSPSSTPNDNLPFATCFRFFFCGRSFGVEPLCFDHQLLHRNPVHSIVPASPRNLPIAHVPRDCSACIGSGISETTELFLLERIRATFAEIV